MKKNMFILAILLCYSVVFKIVIGQNVNYNQKSEFYFFSFYIGNNLNEKDRLKIKNSNISSSTLIGQPYKSGNPQKGKARSYIYFYDKNGNLTSTKFYLKNEKLLNETHYTYNDSNWVTSIIAFNNKGKVISKEYIEYDNFHNKIKYESYNKGGQKLHIKFLCKYDSSRVLETTNFYKDGITMKSKWVYEYFPNHQRKKTTLFNSKSEIDHIWTYECKPDGELIGFKHKDTTTVCKMDDFDNEGNKIKTIRQTNEKGKMEKWIYKYNKMEECISFEQYNSKEILVYQGTRTINENTKWEYKTYKKSGKLKEKIVTIYNKDKAPIEYAVYNKDGISLERKIVYTYDERKNYLETKYFDKNNKINFEYKYDYKYN